MTLKMYSTCFFVILLVDNNNFKMVSSQTTVPSMISTSPIPSTTKITITNTTSHPVSDDGFAWYYILIIVLGSLLLILGITWTIISVKFPHAFPWAKTSENQNDYRIIRVPLLRNINIPTTV